jgi:hypothetical protein
MAKMGDPVTTMFILYKQRIKFHLNLTPKEIYAEFVNRLMNRTVWIRECLPLGNERNDASAFPKRRKSERER